MKRKTTISLVILLAVVGLIALQPAGQETLLAVAMWAEAAPELAWPLFLISFVLAVVFMFPGWVFMVVGGYLFGAVIGGLLAFIANLAGSVVAFFLARTLVRDWVQKKIEGSQRFQGFDKAVARNGFTTILFARLAMLPNNLLNYASGLTAMSLSDFILGTSLGCIPILVANVLIGASTMNLFTTMEEGGLQSQEPLVGLMVLIVAGLALLVILGKVIARRRLRRNTDAISRTE